MGKRNKNVLWKENKKVNRYLKKLNKQLVEDCFAGRFTVEKLNAEAVSSDNGFGFPRWRWNLYTIRVNDNEEPERTVDYWVRWSEPFGLIDISPVNDPMGKGHEYIENGGLPSLMGAVNNFIVKSDFWKKWEDPDYKASHWYSGDELKRYNAVKKVFNEE